MSSRNEAPNNGSDTHKPKEQGKGENHGEHENAGKQELDSAFYLVFGDRDDREHNTNCQKRPMNERQQYRLS